MEKETTKLAVFETLSGVNVNEHLDKKKTGNTELSYLSWAWAWSYFKKALPDAKYEIRHWDDKPYMFDESLGYMVETKITSGDQEHTMWLPVMDGTNHAMLDRPYEVKTKYNSFTVPAAKMTDINKTIMRCLVKNMAMFGLGIYIYAGEDLPETDNDEHIVEQKAEPATQFTLTQWLNKIQMCVTEDELVGLYKQWSRQYAKTDPQFTTLQSASAGKKKSFAQTNDAALQDASDFLNNI